jgi:hypothetical protein
LPDLPDLDALLTATEGARYAGVSVQAVVNWRRRGHLEAVQTPDGPRYTLLALAKAEHATRKRARR